MNSFTAPSPLSPQLQQPPQHRLNIVTSPVGPNHDSGPRSINYLAPAGATLGGPRSGSSELLSSSMNSNENHDSSSVTTTATSASAHSAATRKPFKTEYKSKFEPFDQYVYNQATDSFVKQAPSDLHCPASGQTISGSRSNQNLAQHQDSPALLLSPVNGPNRRQQLDHLTSHSPTAVSQLQQTPADSCSNEPWYKEVVRRNEKANEYRFKSEIGHNSPLVINHQPPRADSPYLLDRGQAVLSPSQIGEQPNQAEEARSQTGAEALPADSSSSPATCLHAKFTPNDYKRDHLIAHMANNNNFNLPKDQQQPTSTTARRQAAAARPPTRSTAQLRSRSQSSRRQVAAAPGAQAKQQPVKSQQTTPTKAANPRATVTTTAPLSSRPRPAPTQSGARSNSSRTPTATSTPATQTTRPAPLKPNSAPRGARAAAPSAAAKRVTSTTPNGPASRPTTRTPLSTRATPTNSSKTPTAGKLVSSSASKTGSSRAVTSSTAKVATPSGPAPRAKNSGSANGKAPTKSASNSSAQSSSKSAIKSIKTPKALEAAALVAGGAALGFDSSSSSSSQSNTGRPESAGSERQAGEEQQQKISKISSHGNSAEGDKLEPEAEAESEIAQSSAKQQSEQSNGGARQDFESSNLIFSTTEAGNMLADEIAQAEREAKQSDLFKFDEQREELEQVRQMEVQMNELFDDAPEKISKYLNDNNNHQAVDLAGSGRRAEPESQVMSNELPILSLVMPATNAAHETSEFVQIKGSPSEEVSLRDRSTANDVGQPKLVHEELETSNRAVDDEDTEDEEEEDELDQRESTANLTELTESPNLTLERQVASEERESEADEEEPILRPILASINSHCTNQSALEHSTLLEQFDRKQDDAHPVGGISDRMREKLVTISGSIDDMTRIASPPLTPTRQLKPASPSLIELSRDGAQIHVSESDTDSGSSSEPESESWRKQQQSEGREIVSRQNSIGANKLDVDRKLDSETQIETPEARRAGSVDEIEQSLKLNEMIDFSGLEQGGQDLDDSARAVDDEKEFEFSEPSVEAKAADYSQSGHPNEPVRENDANQPAGLADAEPNAPIGRDLMGAGEEDKDRFEQPLETKSDANLADQAKVDEPEAVESNATAEVDLASLESASSSPSSSDSEPDSEAEKERKTDLAPEVADHDLIPMTEVEVAERVAFKSEPELTQAKPETEDTNIVEAQLNEDRREKSQEPLIDMDSFQEEPPVDEDQKPVAHDGANKLGSDSEPSEPLSSGSKLKFHSQEDLKIEPKEVVVAESGVLDDKRQSVGTGSGELPPTAKLEESDSDSDIELTQKVVEQNGGAVEMAESPRREWADQLIESKTSEISDLVAFGSPSPSAEVDSDRESEHEPYSIMPTMSAPGATVDNFLLELGGKSGGSSCEGASPRVVADNKKTVDEVVAVDAKASSPIAQL